MTKQAKIQIPSVLAFEKKLVPSDGYFYGGEWQQLIDAENTDSSEQNKEVYKPTALKLYEKSVRGTISNRMKATSEKDILKLNKDIANANPQTVDACSLAEHHDTLKISFTLKVLGGVEQPSACNNKEFYESYQNVAKAYIEKYGFMELAKRYALNIANARFLWRNRLGAEKVKTFVKIENKAWKFDSLDYPLTDLQLHDEKVTELAEYIAKALSAKLPFLLLNIDCYAKVGKSQEVYPSEELVMDKGKGDKSKILYSIDEVAGMHSQKIGNAIRTIDTWYPEFDHKAPFPIAIEPYGSVTNLGQAFREPKKEDFYTLFDKYATGQELENEEQEHYVMAILIRGGVFGKNSKSK